MFMCQILSAILNCRSVNTFVLAVCSFTTCIMVQICYGTALTEQMSCEILYLQLLVCQRNFTLTTFIP